jgi:iron-sulfur cluster assembly accessory protein
MMRVAVSGGGCSGFKYEFNLDGALNPDDRVFEKDGEKVVVDETSLEFLGNADLYFKEDLMCSYFAVTNPNAKSSCGCVRDWVGSIFCGLTSGARSGPASIRAHVPCTYLPVSSFCRQRNSRRIALRRGDGVGAASLGTAIRARDRDAEFEAADYDDGSSG